ncbi:hypothetical protein GJAV_G00081200 [Gymnothorax javanicus]|nr:hypothetical protein GJAV_G00081200 [Gymnothorax javanicus]
MYCHSPTPAWRSRSANLGIIFKLNNIVFARPISERITWWKQVPEPRIAPDRDQHWALILAEGATGLQSSQLWIQAMRFDASIH